MKQYLSKLIILVKKAYKAFRYTYMLVIIGLIILIISINHFWNHKPASQELPSSNSGLAHSSSTNVTHEDYSQSTQGDESVNEEENDEEAVPDEFEEDGSSAWSILESVVPSLYSKPSLNAQTPSVVFIVTGLGLNITWTNHILSALDKNVALAFSPYCNNIIEQIQKAASLGYHSLVSLPMEPYNFPNVDPGPYTLLTGAKEGENLRKVKHLLEKLPKGTGFIGEYGTKFSISQPDLEPILNEVKSHGSTFIDSNTTLHSQIQKTCKLLNMKCSQVNMTLSITAGPNEQEEFVKKIIQNAKENGIIIVSVPAIPAFVSEMPKWVEAIRKNNIILLNISGLQTNIVSQDSCKDNNQGVVDALQ